jgi:HD-GYP domain-containing protein (c-di-GMP phosphodiesterase class II)
MAKKYKLIDVSLLIPDTLIDFDLFIPNDSKLSMYLFLCKNTRLSRKEFILFKETKDIYVIDSEYHLYSLYIRNNMQQIAVSPRVSLETKANLIYHKAMELLIAIFDEPSAFNLAADLQPVINSVISLMVNDKRSLESILKIMAHDYDTHTHSINVGIYTISLGVMLGIKDKELEELGLSAILHDIGKQKIDKKILNKPGPLTSDEFDIVRKHPKIGHSIVLNNGIKDFRVLEGIIYHHERIIGGGYPTGIHGGSIPTFARLISICDVFDALTTKRSYKAPLSTFDSIKLMKIEMKGHFDPAMLNTFIKMLCPA